jgi:hypothetical protein
MCGVYKCKKVPTFLLGTVALWTKKQTSTLAGPMLRVNCLIFSPHAWPPFSHFPSTHANIDDYKPTLTCSNLLLFFCPAQQF